MLMKDYTIAVKRKEPLLSLDLGSIPIGCFEWASHERIVAGCPTGYLAVFDLKDALLNSRKSGTYEHVLLLCVYMLTVLHGQ